jgi:hypothetical protein
VAQTPTKGRSHCIEGRSCALSPGGAPSDRLTIRAATARFGVTGETLIRCRVRRTDRERFAVANSSDERGLGLDKAAGAN